jgi:hypothetical protein
MNPRDLEKWSFYWSELRLMIAAIALLLGGVPPILFVVATMPGLYGLASMLLKLSCIISGASAVYLAYLWFIHKWKVFGSDDKMDMVAFGVMVISGLNLGFTGLAGTNLGMSITSNHIVFILVALLYLWAGFYLWKRWGKHGKHLF